MGILSKLFGRKPEVTTDVLEILSAQHREVDLLFKQLDEHSGNRRVLFNELADLLAAHAAIEEQLFYPTVMAKATEDMLRESVEEHLSIKRMLVDLMALRVDDPEFDAKLEVLKEQVSHHAHEEEEGHLFPQVKSLLSLDERAALGNELLVKFDELVATHPRKHVPQEIDAAAELPQI
jgi:hemerythrin superfamily protein